MSPVAKALFEIAPYVLAFVAGWLIPRRHDTLERVAIGVVAVLSVLLVKSLWPSSPSPDSAPHEWRYLLTLIVFLPIFAAIAVLFLPRQSPALLKRFTTLVLGLDGLASLGLLGAPMTRGWHFQHIADTAFQLLGRQVSEQLIEARRT